MTEKFESKFHRWYVGGQGEIEEKTHIALESSPIVRGITYEQVLREYRKYANAKTKMTTVKKRKKRKTTIATMKFRR